MLSQVPLNPDIKVKSLDEIPMNERRYKCFSCWKIFSVDHCANVNDPRCPICGTPEVKQMCPMDHTKCVHEVFPYSILCPICGEPVCPECGSHDVEVMSRVTGYLQDLSGWNAGKQQEFKDRVRYTL